MKTEQQTCMELIDSALKTACRNVCDPTLVVQEYDIIVDPYKEFAVYSPQLKLMRF